MCGYRNSNSHGKDRKRQSLSTSPAAQTIHNVALFNLTQSLTTHDAGSGHSHILQEGRFASTVLRQKRPWAFEQLNIFPAAPQKASKPVDTRYILQLSLIHSLALSPPSVIATDSREIFVGLRACSFACLLPPSTVKLGTANSAVDFRIETKDCERSPHIGSRSPEHSFRNNRQVSLTLLCKHSSSSATHSERNGIQPPRYVPFCLLESTDRSQGCAHERVRARIGSKERACELNGCFVLRTP